MSSMKKYNITVTLRSPFKSSTLYTGSIRDWSPGIYVSTYDKWKHTIVLISEEYGKFFKTEGGTWHKAPASVTEKYEAYSGNIQYRERF